jgi:hypothetical protein
MSGSAEEPEYLEIHFRVYRGKSELEDLLFRHLVGATKKSSAAKAVAIAGVAVEGSLPVDQQTVLGPADGKKPPAMESGGSTPALADPPWVPVLTELKRVSAEIEVIRRSLSEPTIRDVVAPVTEMVSNGSPVVQSSGAGDDDSPFHTADFLAGMVMLAPPTPNF